MYNYEGAENEGYYWVDSYDQSLIEFIPPEPQKEGYIFTKRGIYIWRMV